MEGKKDEGRGRGHKGKFSRGIGNFGKNERGSGKPLTFFKVGDDLIRSKIRGFGCRPHVVTGFWEWVKGQSLVITRKVRKRNKGPVTGGKRVN